jgi:hypothetical protein
MEKPSASRLARPRMMITREDSCAPATPLTTAKVVTAPSMPPLDPVAQIARPPGLGQPLADRLAGVGVLGQATVSTSYSVT